jgi:alkanesulfonate monooxygenase SsuD/methylene tetrahydromethanopterin reductase-like flavin-dependent oxidoreductase (luciferase family)
VGGHSTAAARRAGQRGDGFYPLGVEVDDLAPLLKTMRAAAEQAGRDADTIELTVTAPRDPDTAKRLVDLGASRFTLSARDNPDPRSIIELVDRYRQRVLA